MTPRLLRLAGVPSAALALALALCSAAAASTASEPDPGDWAAAPAKAKGAKAAVEFTVDPDDGTVAPTLGYEIRRCKGAGKPWSEKLTLATVPVSGGGFEIRDRHRKPGTRRARVDLRLEGTFDSELEAHGTVRATVKLRARRGRKQVTCKLSKLAWTAELAVPYEDEHVDDEAYGEKDYDEEYDPAAEDDYAGDEEYVEDEEYYEDETDPGE